MTPGEATREFYREQGRAEEQARIIKLLEDLDKPNRQACSHSTKDYGLPCGSCSAYGHYPTLIALIKGQNK